MKKLDISQTSLEQWHILQAVVDCGGYAKAAEQLQKSQSTLSYSLNKLQTALGIPLLEIQGRRAVLTEEGDTLLRRARRLLEDAAALENTAHVLAKGWEAEITLNVDVICPKQLLLTTLEKFEQDHPEVRLEIVESALSGTQDAIVHGQADVVLSGITPPGFLGKQITTATMICVAHHNHPLAQQAINGPLNELDLQAYRQIVVRDSGAYRRIDSGWLRAEKRWTVNDFNNSLDLVNHGLGFAWIPQDRVQGLIDDGLLTRLQLAHGDKRSVSISVFYPKRERTGPAAQYLGELLSTVATQSTA